MRWVTHTNTTGQAITDTRWWGGECYIVWKGGDKRGGTFQIFHCLASLRLCCFKFILTFFKPQYSSFLSCYFTSEALFLFLLSVFFPFYLQYRSFFLPSFCPSLSNSKYNWPLQSVHQWQVSVALWPKTDEHLSNVNHHETSLICFNTWSSILHLPSCFSFSLSLSPSLGVSLPTPLRCFGPHEVGINRC